MNILENFGFHYLRKHPSDHGNLIDQEDFLKQYFPFEVTNRSENVSLFDLHKFDTYN